MEVFRITLKKWAGVLQSSGFPARWNSKGVFITYTSSSRALASLENIVHRSGEGLNASFRTTVIRIPDRIAVEEIKYTALPTNWYEYENYGLCQEMGDQWIESGRSAVLKVPSSIIKMEHNYLLNPNHVEFKKIKVSTIEEFKFDPRIKKN